MGRLWLTSLAVVAVTSCSSSSTRNAPATATPSTLPAHFDSYIGAYKATTKTTYVVNGLGHLVNLGDDSIRQLYPTALADHFTYGPAFLSATPKQAGVAFQVDKGRANKLTITPIAGKPVTAKRLMFKESEVRIPAKNANLAGTITEPLSPAPHPGIVIVHGSEPGQRVFYGVWVGLYASLGMTVLSYDKRGNAASTGTYPGELATEDSLAIYADDAAAAAGFIAGWPGVDPKKVGFHGGSQGGWTVPLAVQRHAVGAFAILVSGPAVSTGQQAAWAGITAGIKGAPIVSPSDLALLRTNQLGYQATPAVSRMQQPVLWLNGAADRIIPTVLNKEILEGMHKSNFDVQVLPRTDHGMLEDPTGYDEEAATKLATGLFDRIASWLAARVGTSPRP